MEEKKSKLHKIKHLFSVMATDDFRISFNLCKKELFVILAKLLPKRWKVRAHFGFDDPSTTGQIIECIAPVFPLVYDHVTIQPDFDNQVIDIDAKARGQIRVITILICCAKIYFNKSIRNTIKLYKRK